MKYAFSVFLLIISLHLFANEKQDSLLNLLNNAENDSVKIDLLFKLSNATTGEAQLEYLKKAIVLDSRYDHKNLGYKPFYNIANIKIYSNKADSVQYYLEKALYLAQQSNDSVAIAKTYHSYSGYYQFLGNNAKTISYSQKAREIYNCLKDSFNYYRLLSNEAFSHFTMGNMDEAQKLFNEVINNAKHPRDSWIIASSNLGLGSVMKNLTNNQEALQHNLEAYRIWKELNDTTYFCRALNNIGIVYKNLSMYSMAMSSYQEIIEVNPIADPYALPLAFANMASIYSIKKDFDKANENIDLAIEKMNTIGNLYYKTVLKNLKGDVLVKEEKYAKAKPYIEDALKISEENNFSNEYVTALNLFANILFYTNNYDKALVCAKKALTKAEENLNKKSIYSNNYLIGKILVKKGQPSSAAPYLLKSLELNDSIKKEEEDHNIMESALIYEIGKKDAINESLRNQAGLNKTIIEKTNALVKLQKFYITIIALFLLFSLFFLLIVFRNSRLRKRLNEKLNLSNKKINEKNKKLRELINVNSKIFSIISHDLMSPLIAMHNSVILLKRKNMNPSQMNELLDSTRIQVNTTIELLKNLLRWAKTHESGIQVKLEKIDTSDVIQHNLNLSKLALLSKELQVKINCNEGVEALGDIDLINMVIRNLLANAIKFTPRKGEIGLKTKLANQKVVITISDTGCGISEQDIKKVLSTDEFHTTKGTEGEPGSGLGLKLCCNYIKYMNGEFSIDSTVGKGSKFIVKIPAFSEE